MEGRGKNVQSALHRSQCNGVCSAQSPALQPGLSTRRRAQHTPLLCPLFTANQGQSRVVWPQITSAGLWGCRKHSSVGSTPSTPTGFLEPLWDSDATTGAHSIFYLSKLVQTSNNAKVYRDKICLATFSDASSSAIVTDANKKVRIQVLLFTQAKDKLHSA